MLRYVWAAISVFAALSATGSHAAPATVGEAYFKANWAMCHDVSPARATSQGPALFGIVGNKVAGDPNFGYSDALMAQGAKGSTWTKATLDAFLADPQKAAPGTYMPVAISDADTRLAVVTYLTSLKPKPVGAPNAP